MKWDFKRIFAYTYILWQYLCFRLVALFTAGAVKQSTVNYNVNLHSLNCEALQSQCLLLLLSSLQYFVSVHARGLLTVMIIMFHYVCVISVHDSFLFQNK